MKHYWDEEIEKFDKIYDGDKNLVEKFMDLFRRDSILERAKLVYNFAGKLNKGATIVDIGCGTGRQAIALAKMGFTVYGFDISERGIEMANQQVEDSGLNITFEKCDIVKKKYPPCDMIIGLGLMDYLNDEEVLQILKQVKELNCKFILSFPFKSIKSYVRFIYRHLSGTKIYLSTPEEMEKKFISVGLDNINKVSENLGATIVIHNF